MEPLFSFTNFSSNGGILFLASSIILKAEE